MKILFDQGTPVPLRQHLTSHQVATAFELGWSQLTNGELLKAAESRFDALITSDKNLRYQQNLAERKIAIVVLPFASWPKLQTMIATLVATVNKLAPGEFVEVLALEEE